MYADQTLNLFLNFPFRIYLVLEISPSRSRRPKRAWTAPAAALGQDHLAGPYPQHFFDDPFLGTSIIISFKSHSIPILLLESLPPVIKLKIQPTVKAIYYTYIYICIHFCLTLKLFPRNPQDPQVPGWNFSLSVHLPSFRSFSTRAKLRSTAARPCRAEVPRPAMAGLWYSGMGNHGKNT